MCDPLAAFDKSVQALRLLDRVVRGTPEERAGTRVLKELVLAVAAELSEPESAGPFAEAIAYNLAFPSEPVAGSTCLADAFWYAWTEQLSGLFDPLEANPDLNAITNLGVDRNLDQVVERLLYQLPDTIGLYGLHIVPLYTIATELRHNLQSEGLSSCPDDCEATGIIRRHGWGEQALDVVAFVRLGDVKVPTVVVYNHSSARITAVAIACTLRAFEPGRSEPCAQIGPIFPFLSVQEIGPTSGWAWPLEHASGWNDQKTVRSDLHVFFEDASGQRWDPRTTPCSQF